MNLLDGQLHAFDGTWNDARDTGVYGLHTNVVEFHARYVGSRFIYAGIGTRHGLIGKLLGGAFGVGGKERIEQALNNVLAMPAGVPIDILGFSRGAGLAVEFANVLADRRIPVRFLGLFDLVGAFGIPDDVLGIPFQKINLGYRLTKPDGVRTCYHALALDEQRTAFRPTLIHGAYEVWFRGCHSDVGGGNGNDELSNIPLRWMLYQAKRHGLPVLGYADLPTDKTAAPRQIAMGRMEQRLTDSSYRLHHTAVETMPRPVIEWAPEPGPI